MKSWKKWKWIALFLLGLGWACNNNGNSQEEYSESELYHRSEVDDFVKKAISGGKMEIEMADAAVQRARDPEVRELAEKIRKDHIEANEKLRQVMEQNDWNWAENISAKHRDEIGRLLEIPDDNFDKEFLNTMISTHIKTIRKFENYLSMQDGWKEEENMQGKAYAAENEEKLEEQQERDMYKDRDSLEGRSMLVDKIANEEVERLNRWVKNTLPVLKEHRRQSEDLMDQYN